MTRNHSDPLVTADALADRGGRQVRRLVNHVTYEDAARHGAGAADRMQLVCECGRLDCDGVVTLPLHAFDPGSAPGTVLAHG